MKYKKEQEDRRDEVMEAARKFIGVLCRRPGEETPEFPDGMTYTDKVANYAASLLASDGNYKIWFPFEDSDENGEPCVYNNLGDETNAMFKRLKKSINEAVAKAAEDHYYPLAPDAGSIMADKKTLLVELNPYDVTLSDANIKQILTDPEPDEAFTQIVEEYLENDKIITEDQVVADVMEILQEINPDAAKMENIAEEMVRDHIDFIYPFDRFFRADG